MIVSCQFATRRLGEPGRGRRRTLYGPGVPEETQVISVHDSLHVLLLIAAFTQKIRNFLQIRDRVQILRGLFLAEAAGVSLSFLSDEDAAEAVGAIDPERVVQLLSNLVGNAVKFTPSGGRVDVHFAVQGGVLVAAVRDTGPGIAAEEIPHLFTAFWTGEQKAGARNGHGAGLGLWIARGIAEAHGGELEAESELGKGATFRFRIPLETGTGLIA